MKKQPRVPSFSKIVTTDYPAFIASLVPIVLFLVYLAFLIVQRSLGAPLQPQVTNYLTVALIGITSFTVIYQLYRAAMIRRIFKHGSDIQGRVSSVSFRRVGGHVSYTYSFRQSRLTSGTALRRNERTRSLRKGDRVLIVVDRANPKRAFIRDLYR